MKKQLLKIAVLGDSAMRMASSSNSSGSSAAVGVGVALGASALDFLFSTWPKYTYVLPFIKEIDNKTNQTTIRYFERGIFVGNDWEIKFLLGDTSCSIIKNACNFIQTPIN